MSTSDGCVLLPQLFFEILTLFPGVPVGGGSKVGGVAATDFAVSDASASGVVLTMKRPTEKLSSFAGLLVYSMSQDSPASGATPNGTNTPAVSNAPKQKTYLAGSKALDSLAKLIQATESFFHPSNYGAWAPHLGRFLQTLTWEFHRRVKVRSVSSNSCSLLTR